MGPSATEAATCFLLRTCASYNFCHLLAYSRGPTRAPFGVLRDLQVLAVIVDGVVLGHDPLVLHTQNLGEVRADPRDKGGARFGRPHHKPLVMLGEELLGQVPIGRLHLRHPGQGQLFGQPVLQGLEGMLRAAPRFRRIGGNARHPHLLQAAGHLRQPKLVDVGLPPRRCATSASRGPYRAN